jgi:hypothetical protein
MIDVNYVIATYWATIIKHLLWIVPFFIIMALIERRFLGRGRKRRRR